MPDQLILKIPIYSQMQNKVAIILFKIELLTVLFTSKTNLQH